jgi:hypothetical protein
MHAIMRAARCDPPAAVWIAWKTNSPMAEIRSVVHGDMASTRRPAMGLRTIPVISVRPNSPISSLINVVQKPQRCHNRENKSLTPSNNMAPLRKGKSS